MTDKLSNDLGTRDALIRAGARLIDQGGRTALTLRSVAAAVGVSQNAPYRHFTDKRALVSAVAARGFQDLRAALTAAVDGLLDPRAALQASVNAYFGFARSRPATYRLLFSDPDLTVDRDNLVEEEAMATFTLAANLVRRAQTSGGLPEADVLKLTGLIYATLHGLADIELGGRAREAKGLHPVEEVALWQIELLSALSQHSDDRAQ